MIGDPDMSIGSPADRAHEMELNLVEFLRISDQPLPNLAADRIEALERVRSAAQALADHYRRSLNVGPGPHPTVETLLWANLRMKLAAAQPPAEGA